MNTPSGFWALLRAKWFSANQPFWWPAVEYLRQAMSFITNGDHNYTQCWVRIYYLLVLKDKYLEFPTGHHRLLLLRQKPCIAQPTCNLRTRLLPRTCSFKPHQWKTSYFLSLLPVLRRNPLVTDFSFRLVPRPITQHSHSPICLQRWKTAVTTFPQCVEEV